MAQRPRLFPCAVPSWLLWFVAGLFVAAIVSALVTRSVTIRAPARKERVYLEDLLPTMQSGDVVLLAGVGTFGRVQRFVLNTPISHAGVIVMEHEGTPRAAAWVLEASRKRGVTRTPLWQWLADRDNRIFYRRLRAPPKVLPPARRVAVEEFVSRQLGRPYSYRFWMEATRVLPLVLPMPFDEGGKDEARFCSELVAEALVSVGALDAATPCHLVLPRDLLEARATEPEPEQEPEPEREIDADETHDGKLQWVAGAGLGRVHSLVTRMSAYEVRRRVAEMNTTTA